jgi:hypothetical protein
MFYLDTRNKIETAENSEELKNGSLVIQEAPQKGRKKKKKPLK